MLIIVNGGVKVAHALTAKGVGVLRIISRINKCPDRTPIVGSLNLSQKHLFLDSDSLVFKVDNRLTKERRP